MTDSMVTTFEEAEERAARAKDFTDSERTLVRMLVAWEQWGGHGAESDVDDAVLDIHHVLRNRGFTDGARLTPAGAALLDRARKAGVL